MNKSIEDVLKKSEIRVVFMRVVTLVSSPKD